MRGEAGSIRQARRAGFVAIALVLLGGGALAGCGGGASGSSDATILPAGQLDIKLPDGFKVEDGKVIRPAKVAAGGAGGASAQADPTVTTLVDTKQDPTTALFGALSKFRVCLDDLGVKFIGAPDASNPQSPTNDPNYIKGLSTCAARSNIVQALQASQSANENLTPAEIETRNKGYLKWRSCMIDRNWKIAKPVPDSQGRLFSFSTSGSQNQIQPPPGKDLLSSKDLEQCAAKALKAAK